MFGENPEVVKFVLALLIFMSFDLVTGGMKALYHKNFKAGVMEFGILKKVGIIVAVSFCYFIDKFNILNAGINLETLCALFFIAGELLSVVENLADLGLKLPQKLIDLINKQVSLVGDEVGK